MRGRPVRNLLWVDESRLLEAIGEPSWLQVTLIPCKREATSLKFLRPPRHIPPSAVNDGRTVPDTLLLHARHDVQEPDVVVPHSPDILPRLAEPVAIVLRIRINEVHVRAAEGRDFCAHALVHRVDELVGLLPHRPRHVQDAERRLEARGDVPEAAGVAGVSSRPLGREILAGSDGVDVAARVEGLLDQLDLAPVFRPHGVGQGVDLNPSDHVVARLLGVCRSL